MSFCQLSWEYMFSYKGQIQIPLTLPQKKKKKKTAYPK